MFGIYVSAVGFRRCLQVLHAVLLIVVCRKLRCWKNFHFGCMVVPPPVHFSCSTVSEILTCTCTVMSHNSKGWMYDCILGKVASQVRCCKKCVFSLLRKVPVDRQSVLRMSFRFEFQMLGAATLNTHLSVWVRVLGTNRRRTSVDRSEATWTVAYPVAYIEMFIVHPGYWPHIV